MTDFIHEAPPPENPKPAAPEKPTSEKERQKRVYAYIAVLFTVAFILILWSFLANHRSNQQVIDQLKEQMRTRHILRMQQGHCSIEAGFVLSDLLTDLERTSDHCSNIAGCVIDAAQHNLNLHETLRAAHSDTHAFRSEFQRYVAKYALPAPASAQ